MTEDEIRKKIYERYPKTKKEFTCWMERMRLKELRDEYRKQIEQGINQSEAHKGDEPV